MWHDLQMKPFGLDAFHLDSELQYRHGEAGRYCGRVLLAAVKMEPHAASLLRVYVPEELRLSTILLESYPSTLMSRCFLWHRRPML